MADSENGIVAKGEQPSSTSRPSPSRQSKRRVGFVRRALSIILRLAIWYSLFTAFFSCPTNPEELDEHSPRICKPYLIVRSQLEPHVAPYYKIYGEPYVEVVRPYAHTFHDHIYAPVASVSSSAYYTYGSPRVEQGLRFVEEKWDILVSPQLRSFKSYVAELYSSAVGPQVGHIKQIIAPQYGNISRQLIKFRDGYLVPTYVRAKPIVDRVSTSIHKILIDTAIPYSRRVWSSLVVLLNGTLRPRLASLYFENVEPQLLRIAAKLASYREGGKLKRLQEEESLTETLSSTTSAFSSSITAEASTIWETTSTTTESAVSSTTSLSPTRAKAQEQITSDLRAWQEKFALAADKGCDELEKEVLAIVDNMGKSGAVDAGERLVSELEALSQQQLQKLKTEINNIVRALPEDATSKEEEEAQETMLQLVRASGLAIREQAHSLRMWFDEYDNGLVQHVTALVGSALEILDNIRDLGLQEIGMRWAWMDGVTYKDWAKFHALKKQFTDWQSEVSDVGMNHEAFLEARATGDDILSRGMAIAKSAAQELLTIKEVGAWKIQSGDSSDNFQTDIIDLAKIRAMTRSTTATETPSLATSTVSDVTGEESSRATESLSQISQAKRIETQNLDSILLSEASSLLSSVLDQVENISDSAEFVASSNPPNKPEAIHEQVNKAYSKSAQDATASLESLVAEGLDDTSMTTSLKPQPTANIVEEAAQPESAVVGGDERDTPADQYLVDDDVVFEDDGASLSISVPPRSVQGTGNPSVIIDVADQQPMEASVVDADLLPEISSEKTTTENTRHGVNPPSDQIPSSSVPPPQNQPMEETFHDIVNESSTTPSSSSYTG
uniref:Transcription factor hoxa13 n=1 Tax=Coccidioides posadasii RMSCC 3488 TaxID=454284 RepID=A0A0J6F9S0_COCPO|nr:hypothetical protein CPAG_02045 [Coccidioides posadasii RMSCC 3488]